MKIYQGISASQEVAIGKACILASQKKISIPKVKILESELDSGWMRFETAIQSVSDYYSKLLDNSNEEQQQVIQTYLLMLSDTAYIDEIKSEYKKSLFNIEYCVKTKVEQNVEQLRTIGDEYLSERAQDIEDVFEKVLFALLGHEQKDFENIEKDAIIVSESLKPSEAMALFKKNIKGLVLQEGGISSHIAILAKTYGIPAIFGIKAPCEKITHGTTLIVDAQKALVIVEPDKAIFTDYKKKIEIAEKSQQELNSFIDKAGCTKDGTVINIFANISSIDDALFAKEQGADGIGLFRTEFLFMDDENRGKNFSENEQFQVYSEILKIFGDKPVIIRTLDSGGDKITNFDIEQTEQERNPLLGCRAIRFCLKNKTIFKTQLRALYRASVYGNLKIILPMISNRAQIEQTKTLIREIQNELHAEGKIFNPKVPIGIMIETPAAAIMADYFAKDVDFFSVGSNDLTQYLLVVDRENAEVSHLYDELDPAVLRAIKHSELAAKKNNIPISVCGEMASREETMKHLVGLGIRYLSVSPKLITKTKQTLLKYTIPQMESLVQNISSEY